MRPVGIVILGSHRSGTSVLADMLLRWGAYGRKEDTGSGDIWNPKGYWEYAPLVRFNEKLLHVLGARWYRPPQATARESLLALTDSEPYRSEAARLVSCFSSHTPWLWKDPRLSVLLPFWSRFWGHVLYVISVRDPKEVANSTRLRNHLTMAEGLHLWQSYMVAIMRDVRDPRVFVSYESLIADPAAESRRICEFLNPMFGIDASELDLRCRTLAEAVDPNLRRSGEGLSAADNALLTTDQIELHRWLQQECARFIS